MVVGDIDKFLYCPVQFFLCPESLQVGTSILQHVEMPLHRRVVIWVSSLAHALGHMDRFAELYECL